MSLWYVPLRYSILVVASSELYVLSLTATLPCPSRPSDHPPRHLNRNSLGISASRIILHTRNQVLPSRRRMRISSRYLLYTSKLPPHLLSSSSQKAPSEVAPCLLPDHRLVSLTTPTHLRPLLLCSSLLPASLRYRARRQDFPRNSGLQWALVLTASCVECESRAITCTSIDMLDLLSMGLFHIKYGFLRPHICTIYY